MTLAILNAMVRRANAAIKAGDCATAQQVLGQAWLGLGEYSATLARRGASPSSAVSVHKAISKALVLAGKRCGMSADGLMPPSGASTGQNPDLLAPSFRGPGDQIYDSVVTTITTLGIGAAVVGLGIGIYTMFRHGE